MRGLEGQWLFQIRYVVLWGYFFLVWPPFMERLPCPGLAELNNSSAKNGNGYLTAPEVVWLHHLDPARNAVIAHLTSGVRVEQARTAVDMGAGKFWRIQGFPQTDGSLYQQAAQHELRLQRYQDVHSFSFSGTSPRPYIIWIWNDPDFQP